MSTAQTTITQLLLNRDLYTPDKKAFTFISDEAEETITYHELFQRALSVAAMLHQHDSIGQRVILAFPSGLDYICSFFGCLLAGAIAVPLYPPKTSKRESRFDSILEDSGAIIALTTTSILDSMKHRNSSYLNTVTKWLATDQWQVDPEARNCIYPSNKDDVAFLQYTSGSTSTPKGVMVTHDNIISNTRVMKETLHFPDEGVMVSWLPLFHDMGLVGIILNTFCNAYHGVILSPIDFLQKPVRWLEAIVKYRGEITAAPNFAYELCVRKVTQEQIENLDLSSLSHAVCGAEPIKPSTIEDFIRVFSAAGFERTAFCPCYGLAEATLLVSGSASIFAPKVIALDKKQLTHNRVVPVHRSVPLASPNIEVVSCGSYSSELLIQIVDPETLTICPPERVGEIWVAGASMAQGYWNRPLESQNTFGAQILDGDGTPYMRTGDLGFMTSGELFITGRLKDCILIRGENHYPNDIEWSVVNSHPYLNKESCAAFSIVDSNDDEQLVIVAEIDKQFRKSDLTPVVSAIRTCIAEEHALQMYALVLCGPGAVPKTTSGKIQRKLCKSLFIKESLSSLLTVIRNRVVPNWGKQVITSLGTEERN